jgi:hypothetical protein
MKDQPAETTPEKKPFPFYSLMCLIYYCLVVLICKVAECRCGQSLSRAIKDCICFWTTLTVLTNYSDPAIYTFGILLYEVIDMFSYQFTGDSFSLQFFHGICAQDILTERVGFTVQGFFLCFMCCIMANHPPHFKEWPIVIPAKARAVLLSISVFMLYDFWCRETAAFDPNGAVTHFDTRQLMPSNV